MAPAKAALTLGALTLGGLALIALRDQEPPPAAPSAPRRAPAAVEPARAPRRSSPRATTPSIQQRPAPAADAAPRPAGPEPAPTGDGARILAILDEASQVAKAPFDEEVLARLRALGPEALAAGLRELERADARVLAARALAGIPEAGGLIEKTLGELEDEAALAALSGGLPAGRESRDRLGRAFLAQRAAEGRRVLLRALGDRGDVDRVFIAEAGLRDADPGIRGESAAMLARLADPRDREALAELARRDPDVGVRARALIALGAIGGPEAAEQVAAAAFDHGLVPSLRASAAVALGRLGDAPARAALRRMAAEDPDSLVRRRAASILALLERGGR